MEWRGDTVYQLTSVDVDRLVLTNHRAMHICCPNMMVIRDVTREHVMHLMRIWQRVDILDLNDLDLDIGMDIPVREKVYVDRSTMDVSRLQCPNITVMGVDAWTLWTLSMNPDVQKVYMAHVPRRERCRFKLRRPDVKVS